MAQVKFESVPAYANMPLGDNDKALVRMSTADCSMGDGHQFKEQSSRHAWGSCL